MKLRILWMLMFVIICVANTFASAAIKRVYMKPVRCHCKDNGKHGDIYAAFADGHIVRLTTGGMCSDPKIAADGQTVGWTIREHHWYRDLDKPSKNGVPAQSLFAFPAHVRCWRAGNVLGTIHPEKVYEMNWKFHNEGRQVATKSMGSHGPTYFQLFNTPSGKLIASALEADGELPGWAQGL